jgi:rhomboid family GlyGly-CTERM serine protease
LPALLIACCVLLEAGGPALRDSLRFERSALAAGEFWRLLTGHLVHLGWPHLLLNAAGVVLVWALVGSSLSKLSWGVLIVVISLLTSASLWYLDTGLDWYVGLSGVLHGLLIAGLVAGLVAGPRSHRAESLFLAAAVVFKLAYEQLSGPLPGSEASAGGPVVVNAHLYGAIAGFVAVWPLLIRAGR